MEILADGTFLDRVIVVLCLIGTLYVATSVISLICFAIVWINDRLHAAIDWFGHIFGW